MAAFGSDKWYVSTPYGLVQLCIVDCITLSLSFIQTHTNTHSSIDFYVLHSPPCHGSLCRPFLILQRVWTYSFFIYIYFSVNYGFHYFEMQLQKLGLWNLGMLLDTVSCSLTCIHTCCYLRLVKLGNEIEFFLAFT